MTRKFCQGCCNYTLLDDGTELCLDHDEIKIKDVKVCPDDEYRDVVSKWNDAVRRSR